MNTYSIALFLHIVGALGFFAALVLEWTGLWQIGRAMLPEQVRPWMELLKGTNRLGFPAMLTTVVTGIYMLLTAWGWVPWIAVTLGALVVVIVLSAAVTGRRFRAFGRALSTANKPVFPLFASLAYDPLVWISIQVRVAIAVGIVFLKIAKPDLVGSLLTIGVAIVVGAASAWPVSRRERAVTRSAG
jgi:hypothetical protein